MLDADKIEKNENLRDNPNMMGPHHLQAKKMRLKIAVLYHYRQSSKLRHSKSILQTVILDCLRDGPRGSQLQ